MCIASCRVADYRRTASAGSPVGTASFFSSGPRALAPVSPPVPAGSRSHARRRRTAVLRRSQQAQTRQRVASLPRAAAQERMGRLCQKALCRSSAGLGLSRALYASRRERQQPFARSRRDLCQFPLERLSRERPSLEQGHASRRRRVHAPLPAPRPPNRLPSHPSYGLFANGHRADKLELCRRALNVPSPRTAHANSDNTGATSSDHEPPPCPCCGGRMIVIETFDGPLCPPYHVRKLDGL